MKAIIRYVCFALCFSIIVGSLYGFTSSNNKDETITSEITRDEKIPCTATIDQKFDDSSVLVIMDNITGGINKQHDLSYFGDIGATSVKDLTAMVTKNVATDIDVSRGTSVNASINEDAGTWFEINTETFRQILKIELSTHSKENVLKVIKELEKIEGIKYAGPNYIAHPCSSPNDFNQVKKWEFLSDRMNVIGAWDITTGTRNIKVGIIDSGIDIDHPDLVDNLVEGANFMGTTGTNDTYGHGTHIAGIIGAVGNNQTGTVGICWNVSLVPLKVFDENTADSDYGNAILAISYATDNGIHILNYSSAGYNACPAFAQAIMNYPGLFVACASNENNNNDTTPVYPANYSTTLTNVISVGASDYDVDSDGVEEMWWYSAEKGSNYGAKTVDIFASGYNIYSTIPCDNLEQFPWEGYSNDSGTSMAAPQVAGAAALIMSVRPDMTPEEVKKCIMDSVDKSDAFEGKCVSGGRLNVYKAVQLATQPQTFTGDVNGDGMADMIVTRRLSTGYRAIDTYLGQSDGKYNTVVTKEFSQVYNYADPVFVGDVNGDGRTDLIVHSVVSGKRYLLVYRGTATGAFGGASLCATTDDHDYYTTKAKFFVADANGDGKDDFIVHIKNSSGKRANLTYLGQASGGIPYFDSTASVFTSTNNYGVAPVFVGDFNGDGKADIVVPHATSDYKRCLLVYKGQSSAPYFAAGVKFNSTRNHDPRQWPCQYFVSDVNGDGKDDLVVHWKNANGKRNNLVYKGGSSGLTTEAVATAATSNNYIATDPVFVGDINGDGYGDMLVQWQNAYNQRNMLVYKGTSSATYGTGTSYNTGDTLDLPERPSCFFLADATGDGRADFIVKYNSGGVVAFITYAGTSSGSFSTGAYSNISTTDPPYFNN